jgi:hypothetical protein
MAFNREKFSVIVQPIGEDGIRFFSYETDDDIATVAGSGYFVRVRDYGARVSDLIFIIPATSGEPFIMAIEAIDADGTATAAVAASDAGLPTEPLKFIRRNAGNTAYEALTAEEVRIAIGAGTGDGDMLASAYDPEAVGADTFDPLNHHAFALPGYISARARKMPDRLAEDGSVNVKEFAAFGAACGEYDIVNGTGTDDTDAIEAARAFAESEGIKSLFFPRTKENFGYGISAPITFDSNDWEIFGQGKYATTLVAKDNEDIFQIDPTTATVQRGTIRDIGFRRNSATYDSAVAIHCLGNTGSTTGVRHWTFRDIVGRNVAAVLKFEDTGKVATSIGCHGFNMIERIDVPLDANGRYPDNAIWFDGAVGPHNQIIGGQLRSESACIRIGRGGVNESLGDLIIIGPHCVLGDYGIVLAGPDLTGNPYRYNIQVIGAQCDVVNVNPFLLSNIGLFTVIAHGLDLANSITSCTEYFFKYNNQITQVSTASTQSYQTPISFTAAISHTGTVGFNSRATNNSWQSYGAGASATIASGVITATRSYMIVDTEGAAASDDLDSVSGGSDGDMLVLRTANSGRDVTVKHSAGAGGTGTFRLNGQTDKVLSSTSDILMCMRVGGLWVQFGYGDNAT